MSTATVKYHKNSKGKWAKCNASVRACRYGGDAAHKIGTVDETTSTETKPVVSQAPAAVAALQPAAAPAVAPEEEEQWGVNYTIPMDKVDNFENEIAKANRRLERAGIEDRFTYTLEPTVVYDERTGHSYQAMKAVLNKPVISVNGWNFMGTIDHFVNEEGEQVVTIHGAHGKSFEKEYETDDAVRCDHCGHRRARNKTYVVKNAEGEYKQVGSNCLAAFLGVRPKGLWALEEPIIDEPQYQAHYGTAMFTRENLLLDTRKVVALALALSKGGEKYVPTSHSHSTKEEVLRTVLGETTTHSDVNAEEYAALADEMIKSSVFDEADDYGRNMKTLLSQPAIPFRKVGYVVSLVPYYNRQKNAIKRAEKPKAKGYIGDVNEVVHEIQNTKVERVQSFPNNYSYYGGTSLMIVLRTPDNKLIKWVTSSSDERLDLLKKGTVIDLHKVKVKGTDSWNDEDQTVVKNVNFSLVDGYDTPPAPSDEE